MEKSGFNEIKKITRNGVLIAKMLPGEYYVTKLDEMIVTVLGSCIAVCIRDAKSYIGGMNHFMYPASTNIDTDDNELPKTCFGNYAMEYLLQDYKDIGGDLKNIEVKLFGGGKILSSQGHIGEENIIFAKQFLTEKKYTIASEDIGGEFSRKITYSPKTGKAMVRRLSSTHRQVIIKQENCYQSQIKQSVSC